MNEQTITDLALKAYRGDTIAQARVTKALIDMYSFHENLVNDVKVLEDAHGRGRHDTRVDPAKYTGEYKKTILMVNSVLDAVAGSLKTSGEPSFGNHLSSTDMDVWYGNTARIRYDPGTSPLSARNIQSSECDQETGDAYSMPEVLTGYQAVYRNLEGRSHVPGNGVSIDDRFRKRGLVLPGVLSTINLQVSEIASHNHRIRRSTTKLASETARLARNVGSIHYHAGRGDEKVAEILKGMKQLSEGLRDISSGSDAVVRLAEKTDLISEAASEQVKRTKKDLCGIAEAASEADTCLAEILLLADRLDDTAGHIQALADRVEFLGHRATSSPKRPIDHTGNFPIHGHELAFLATASRSSAEKTIRLIKELQKKSRQAQSAMGTLKTGIEQGNAAFHESSALFSQIAGSVEQIGNHVDYVSGIAGSHERSVQRLGTELQKVNDIVQGTAERASDVAHACRSTSSSLFGVVRDMGEVNSFAKNVVTGTIHLHK